MKYPEITVDLSDVDGNAFSILGKVIKTMRQNKVSNDEIEKFRKEAMSGDYDNLLRVCMEWVNIE